MQLLKATQEKLSKGDPLDEDLLAEVVKAKEELMEAVKSARLEIIGVAKRKVTAPPPELQEKIVNMNEEIHSEFGRAIHALGLRNQIEELKAEMDKDSSSGGAEIKERIVAALDATALMKYVEKLHVDLQSFLETTTEDKEDGKIPFAL